jgi:uncharacterized membrane protein
MSYYEILLFLHLFGVAVWFGGGFLLLVLNERLRRASDNATLEGLFNQAQFLALGVFTPAGLLVLIVGVLMVIEGPWSFGDLWVILGLVGYAFTFITGLFVLRPEAEAIDARLKRDGMTEAAASEIRRMFTKMRLDYAVIAAVIADMALKPTRSDTGALLAIAAIVVVVAASVVVGLRSAESPLPDRRPA